MKIKLSKCGDFDRLEIDLSVSRFKKSGVVDELTAVVTVKNEGSRSQRFREQLLKQGKTVVVMAKEGPCLRRFRGRLLQDNQPIEATRVAGIWVCDRCGSKQLRDYACLVTAGHPYCPGCGNNGNAMTFTGNVVIQSNPRRKK